MKNTNFLSRVVLLALMPALAATVEASAAEMIEPLLRSVDLKIGESQTILLSDGSRATVKLLGIREHVDAMCRVDLADAVALLIDDHIDGSCGSAGVEITELTAVHDDDFLRDRPGPPDSLDQL